MNKRYGPARTAENKTRCVETLIDEYSEIRYQCRRIRKYGDYCRLHKKEGTRAERRRAQRKMGTANIRGTGATNYVCKACKFKLTAAQRPPECPKCHAVTS